MKRIQQIALALTLCVSASLNAGPDLIKAAVDGNLDFVMERAVAGENLNDVDKYGWTALMWAVYCEQLPVTEFLVQQGADPNIQSTRAYRNFPKGTTALIISARQGRDDQAAVLIKAKPKMEAVDEVGKNAVAYAREGEQHDVLKAFGLKIPFNRQLEDLLTAVNAGKSVNSVDQYGWTPLMWATNFDDLDTAEAFLEKGADPNIQSTSPNKTYPKGTTALTITGQTGAAALTTTLLKKGAKTNLADSTGNTVESYARKASNIDVLNAIGIKASSNRDLNALLDGIGAGKSVNTVDQYGWTPLMWATYYQELPTVEYLLEKGADPNIQSTVSFKSIKQGGTALIIAAYYGLDGIAGVLCKSKAKRELTDSKGKTAFDFARKYGFNTVQCAMVDTSPLKKNYNKFVLGEIIVPKDVAKDYPFAASECQFGFMEQLKDNNGTECVELAVPGKTYGDSTIVVQIEILEVAKTTSNSFGPLHTPESYHMYTKVKFVDGASGSVVREEYMADPNPDSPLFSLASLGSYHRSFVAALGPTQNPGKDIGTAVAAHVLSICGAVSQTQSNITPQATAANYLGQQNNFTLSTLRDQKLAVFPLSYADLSWDVAKSVYEEYGNRIKFLETISSRLSGTIREFSADGFIDSKTLSNLFSGEDAKAMLDARQLLPWAGKTFAAGSPNVESRINALAKLPALKDIRYAVIPRLIRMSRTAFTSGGSWTPGPGPGPGGVGGVGAYTGPSTSARTRGSLLLAIIDLTSGRIVWDGIFTSSSSSALLQTYALHENEDALLQQLQKEIRKPAPKQ